MNLNNKVYLDYQSTTPIDPRVINEMVQVMQGESGNPMSKHFAGEMAKLLIENSRRTIANFIGASPDEIIFTSGATESINMAIKGLAMGLKEKGNHIITSTIEHKAVLETCLYLKKNGFNISYVNVNSEGFIDLNELSSLINENTILIAIGHANNEIGVIQDLQKIKTIASNNNIHLFLDCAQSFGKEDININNLDSMAFSGHKIYGPKGIGGLYIANKWKNNMTKLMHGGGQEFGLRAGSHNVPAIVGLEKAIEIAFSEKENDNRRMRDLRDKLWINIAEKINDVQLNGSIKNRLTNNLNFSLPSIPNELIISGMADNFAFSTGSACMSDNNLPSHVINALGKESYISNTAIRISLGRYTTLDEINNFSEEFIKIVKRIKRIRNF